MSWISERLPKIFSWTWNFGWTGYEKPDLKLVCERKILACEKKKPNLRSRMAFWIIEKEVNKMKGSWKTTMTGICTILVAVGTALKVLLDGDASTSVNFEATIAAITVGIGLISARDNNKSSEDVGAK